MTSPRPRDDQAVSSILGFIVGFALLAGSMAAVAYFMISIPDSGTPQDAKDLSSQVRRAADALASSPGHPHDWHEACDDGTWETPSQIGLLRAGDGTAQLDKLHCLQSGAVNGTVLLEANNLRKEGIRLYAEGKVVPLAAMQPPSTMQTATVAGTLNTDLDDLTVDEASLDAANILSEADGGFTPTLHEWAWRADRHPAQGLGNTFIDHPWIVHTQMLPAMAGIPATYTMQDLVANNGDEAQAAIAAAEDYTDDKGQPQEELSRWHVIVDGEPDTFPSSLDGAEENLLTINYRRDAGNSEDSNGVGHWRTYDGMRSYALLDPVDVTGASQVNLSLEHVLRVEDDESDSCWDDYDEKANWSDCVEVRPAIRFWNTTEDGEWTRLKHDTTDCTPDPGAPAWDDRGAAESVHQLETRLVDLCEALENTDGELWLAIEWFTECRDSNGDPEQCSDPKHANRGWFLDTVEVTVDDKTAYRTNFEIGGEMKTVLVSQGVDHGLHESVARPAHLQAPLEEHVRDGGNLVALAPGGVAEATSWLNGMGLSAIERTGQASVQTVDPDRLVMRMPHELPTSHPDYEAATYAWEQTDELNVVQNTTDDTEQIATLAVGAPLSSGKITGLGYDLTAFEDEELREELVRNLYTSTVFLDPTFETQNVTLPESATVPVNTAQRVVLAEVTTTGEHQVPLEITMYAWPEGMG